MATKPKAPLTLEQLREAVASHQARGYGLTRAYAVMLNATPGFAPGWYDEKKPTGAVELERIAYTELLKNRTPAHPNPYESWRQIKLQAKRVALEAAAEAAKAGSSEAEAAEGEAEAEAAPSDADKLSAWMLDRLASMIKKVEKAEAVNFSALMVLQDLKNAQARIAAPATGADK
jgi:hypothetical protein